MAFAMRRLLLILLTLPAIAHADYDPFSSKPPTSSIGVVMPSGGEGDGNNPGNASQPTPQIDPASLLDKELKGLLGDLKARDESDKNPTADTLEYVATTNCVDIYYHTTEKRYEERKSRTCLKEQAKRKIESEIKKNEASLNRESKK